jgi:hypothetical protein
MVGNSTIGWGATQDVIDFGGLLSGNAIGPPRSVSVRLTTNF